MTTVADQTTDGKPNIRELDIDLVRTDGGTQIRTVLTFSIADEYRDAIEAGETLPPVVVVHDDTDYWLADGFHRLKAHELAGLRTINADIRSGTKRDAVLYACSANADHGFRRSHSDKHNAVVCVLELEPAWSDRKIAEHCRVSHPFVAKLRGEPTGNVSSCREGRDGRVRKSPAPKSKPSPASTLEKLVSASRDLDQHAFGQLVEAVADGRIVDEPTIEPHLSPPSAAAVEEDADVVTDVDVTGDIEIVATKDVEIVAATAGKADAVKVRGPVGVRLNSICRAMKQIESDSRGICVRTMKQTDNAHACITMAQRAIDMLSSWVALHKQEFAKAAVEAGR